MTRVSPVKSFNSKHRVRTAEQRPSGLHTVRTIIDSMGNMGLSGNPYNPGGERSQVARLQAEEYMEHLDRTGAQPSQDARELYGITTDSQTGQHTVRPEHGLLAHTGTPLQDWMSIPLAVNPSGSLAGQASPPNAAVQHWFNDSSMAVHKVPIGKDKDIYIAAGHHMLPNASGLQSLEGTVLDPKAHIDQMHSLIVSPLVREFSRDDYTPENSGQVYTGAVDTVAPMWEPAGDGSGGYQSHNTSSAYDSIKNPIPLHVAVETTLKNIFHPRNSGLMIDPNRSTGDTGRYEQYLARAAQTARFAVDTSPVNFVHHQGNPNFMVRDYQHVFRALESSDPVVRELAHRYYRQSENNTGSIDFTGMTPRSSATLGKLAWDSGANQSTLSQMRKTFNVMKEHGSAGIKMIMPGLGNYGPVTQQRINDVQESNIPVLTRRPAGDGELEMNTEKGMFGGQQYY